MKQWNKVGDISTTQLTPSSKAVHSQMLHGILIFTYISPLNVATFYLNNPYIQSIWEWKLPLFVSGTMKGDLPKQSSTGSLEDGLPRLGSVVNNHGEYSKSPK